MDIKGFRELGIALFLRGSPQLRTIISVWSMPWKRISSIWQMVWSRALRILDIVCWKISGVELMLNGVTKVVISLDSSSRSICQNALLAWSLENILLVPSFERLFSTEGLGWTSCWTALLRLVRSTQVLYFAIWFEDWDNSCTPFSWSCHRRDDTLFKHCLYLTFHLWYEVMGDFPWIVQAKWLSISMKCHVAFSFKPAKASEVTSFIPLRWQHLDFRWSVYEKPTHTNNEVKA